MKVPVIIILRSESQFLSRSNFQRYVQQSNNCSHTLDNFDSVRILYIKFRLVLILECSVAVKGVLHYYSKLEKSKSLNIENSLITSEVCILIPVNSYDELI